jgi:hypothetical protein
MGALPLALLVVGEHVDQAVECVAAERNRVSAFI